MFQSATTQLVRLPDVRELVATPNYAALRAFKAVDTLFLKGTVAKAAFEGQLTDELMADFESLLVDARHRVKERNAVAHALWAITDVYPNDVLLQVQGRQFGDESYVRYTVSDFRAILQRIEALNSQAFKLTVRCQEHIRQQKALQRSNG